MEAYAVQEKRKETTQPIIALSPSHDSPSSMKRRHPHLTLSHHFREIPTVKKGVGGGSSFGRRIDLVSEAGDGGAGLTGLGGRGGLDGGAGVDGLS